MQKALVHSQLVGDRKTGGETVNPVSRWRTTYFVVNILYGCLITGTLAFLLVLALT